jgi:Cof subfamily protein (haloacid dehalogenase superfamily)
LNKNSTLYISDLDGTLLNESSVLSEYTKNTLNKLISRVRGIDFTVATGRTTDAAENMMADIKLNIPIVSFNGVAIYDTKQKHFVKVYQLAAETVKKIISILKYHGMSWLMYELKDNKLISYHESINHKPILDFIEDRKERYDSTFCQVDDLYDVPPEHIIYFTLLDTYDRLKPVCDDLRGVPGINIAMVDDSSIGGVWWLEVFSAEASKENAVVFMRELYGYKKVVGFGDNYNDLTMFRACDVRVAVKNALGDVKAAADSICESNGDDGVVRWIESHISHIERDRL